MTTLSALLAAFIVVLLVARAVWVLRAEAARADRGAPRGVAPGTGYTEIDSDYSSGVGGGSQLTLRVPKDPQEYARAFIPRRDGKHRS